MPLVDTRSTSVLFSVVFFVCVRVCGVCCRARHGTESNDSFDFDSGSLDVLVSVSVFLTFVSCLNLD